MKFGSLFSGIGGFDLGFEQSGLECAWQVEIDKDCNRVLEKHWPDVRRYQDVSTIGKLESVDVICGGFPCQDLSVAGKRKGLAGERSGLWFEFLRIIELNRPRWIVIENVPGLLSGCGCAVCGQVARNLRAHTIWRSRYFDRTGNRYNAPCAACDAGRGLLENHSGRNFQIVLTGLVELGYCVASRILDAQYDGVAQRRRRVFIIGSLGDGSSAQILFESESVSWNPPTRGEAGERVAHAVTTGTGKSSGPRNGNGDPLHLITGSLAAHSKEHGHAMTTQQAAESGHLIYPIQEVGARESKNQNGIGIGVGADGDVMYTLQSGQVHGVAMPLKAKANSSHDESHETYVTHALRSEGADASEDGTGRGAPLVVANCFNGYTGGPDDNDAQANHLIAFSSKDHGADAGEIAPTLRSQNFKDSHINGGGQVAIAFAENQRGEVRTSETMPQLSCAGGKPGSGYPAIAFQQDATDKFSEEVTPTMRGKSNGGTRAFGVAAAFGVRRLTPRECERLQGFPDDWTLYDASGKEISDSARYRMLGNAVAVPVATWIGQRVLETR